MKLVTPEKLRELAKIKASYQSADAYAISEPRIEMILKRLSALLDVVTLEVDGKPVEADGFRLRNPSDWAQPSPSIMSELWHISNACNMRCPFCYEEGDPEGCTKLNDVEGMVTMEEIQARLRHRDSRRQTAMARPLTYTNEIFCNPQAMDIIERLRAESPEEVLTFVTNGTYLTRPVVERLARLRPMFFNFSVNSLDPLIRRKILVDRNAQVAIEAIELLREYEIPYLGSLVCWPTIPWSDIEATVRRLDEAGCAIIRYSLPAYSKHLKGQKFDREAFWDAGVELALRLRAELRTPIKIEPYHYVDRSFLPHLAGCIQGSPAEGAGLCAGDRIVDISGHAPISSNHALHALNAARKASTRITLAVERKRGDDVQRLEVTLDDDARWTQYPYAQMRDLPGMEWGLLLVDNLRFSYLKSMLESIREAGAHRVLVCSSELMKPIVEEMITMTGAFGDIDLRLEVPENRFFGGTIVLGDLLVVEDYVGFIDEYVKGPEGPVDLVLIPSSPFSRGVWQRDLAGIPFTEIQRRTGVPTQLLHCKPLNG